MKTLILWTNLIWIGGMTAVGAQDATPAEALRKIEWSAADIQKVVAQNPSAVPIQPAVGPDLAIAYNSFEPGRYVLATVGPPDLARVTSRKFAISGFLSYANIEKGSTLEARVFVPADNRESAKEAYFSDKSGSGGASLDLEGSKDSSFFSLSFDTASFTQKPTRIDLVLTFAGASSLHAPQTVRLAGVKFLQSLDAVSPTPPTPAAASAPPPAPEPPPAVDTATEPGESLVENLTWDSPFAQKVLEGSLISVGNSAVLQVSRIPPYYNATLFKIDAPNITANVFGVTGAMRLFKVPPESYLQITCYYEDPENPYYGSRLYFDKCQRTRTTDWLLFDLRDRHPANHAKMWRLEISLVMGDNPNEPATDGTTVQLGNLKLVQYAAPTEPPIPVSPPQSSAASPQLTQSKSIDRNPSSSARRRPVWRSSPSPACSSSHASGSGAITSANCGGSRRWIAEVSHGGLKRAEEMRYHTEDRRTRRKFWKEWTDS